MSVGVLGLESIRDSWLKAAASKRRRSKSCVTRAGLRTSVGFGGGG